MKTIKIKVPTEIKRELEKLAFMQGPDTIENFIVWIIKEKLRM